jgi:hypothetical protein
MCNSFHKILLPACGYVIKKGKFIQLVFGKQLRFFYMKTEELVFPKDKYNTNEGKNLLRNFFEQLQSFGGHMPLFSIYLFVNWDIVLY